MIDAGWWECAPCDVRWKSTTAEPCWSCGAKVPTMSQPPLFPGYAGMSLNFG